MTSLARIHVLKKKAGLDEENYRDLMERETGRRSAKDLSEAERRRFAGKLQSLSTHSGSQTSGSQASGKAMHMDGPYARKLRALWIAGYNLGVIRNPNDAALLTFLKRQTGLDHARFLHHDDDATKAIQALHQMIRRTAGNDGLFRRDAALPAVYNDPRFQVCLHIWSELIRKDSAPASTLTGWFTQKTGKDTPGDFSAGEWFDLQNALGALLRAAPA